MIFLVCALSAATLSSASLTLGSWLFTDTLLSDLVRVCDFALLSRLALTRATVLSLAELQDSAVVQLVNKVSQVAPDVLKGAFQCSLSHPKKMSPLTRDHFLC